MDDVGANTATNYDTCDGIYRPGKEFLPTGRINANKWRNKKTESAKETTKMARKNCKRNYCIVCKERVLSDLMKPHAEQQHPEIIVQCKKCFEVFTYPSKTHVRRTHEPIICITTEVLQSYYQPLPRSQATPIQLRRLKIIKNMSREKNRKTHSVKRVQKKAIRTKYAKGKLNFCLICEEQVGVKELLTHTEEHHPDIVMQCKKCSYVSMIASRLHLRRAHDPKMTITMGVLKAYYQPLAISHATPQQLRRIDFLKSKGTPETHGPNDMLPSHSVSKRPSKKLILPSIAMFNCHDCQASFRKMQDLFDHCRNHHKHFVNGKSGRFLVPVNILNRE